MRYDKEIYFVKEGQKVYDEATADYIDKESTKTKRYASVNQVTTTAGALNHKLVLEFGQIAEDSYIVRLQNHYNEPYDYVLIDGVKYNVNYSRKLRTKHNLVVSEIQ